LNRRRLWLLLTPILVLVVAGYIGDAFGPSLITHHPLLEMFLNPRNRYLALASPKVGVVAFFLMGFFRLVLTDPLFFVLGRLYGDAALRWAEKKMGEESIQMLQRIFAKAAYPIVLIAPNGYVCLLAGATEMRPSVFITLNVTGTIARLIIIRLSADALSVPLDAVLRFIRRYQWWLTGLSVVVVGFQVIQSRRKGRSDLASVSTIERELAQAADAAAGEGSPGPVEQPDPLE
jgi:membrane protein DedA with SNARE-associated domain